MSDDRLCRICGGGTVTLGTKCGWRAPQPFELRTCGRCHFSFVANPRTDVEAIYDADYYAGRGADPLVDYIYELECPDLTIRQYEWRGILRAVRQLVPVTASTRWLDFGCGNGGLVRYCRAHSDCAAYGYDSGWMAQRAAAAGIPYLSAAQLGAAAGTFDVVTAIEVLEHIPNPLAVLRTIRAALKPGGLFFYTTGNAQPFRDRLLAWSYVNPTIHVSFFEPTTLERALTAAGFRPEHRGYLPGFDDILRFKILKTLRVRRAAAWQVVVPWSLLCRFVERQRRVAAHPIGWALPVPTEPRTAVPGDYALDMPAITVSAPQPVGP